MSKRYYDAAGVLVLTKVTPVIEALFGRFFADPSSPGNGEVRIARLSDSDDPSWGDIYKSLLDLAIIWSLPVQGKSAKAVLEALATHFVVSDDERLRHLFEHINFENDANLDDLFLLATRFDDKHGLKAIKLEGAWYSDHPTRLEYGGHGVYISAPVFASSNSSQAISLGEDLHKAIGRGDLNEAVARIATEVSNLISGISDKAFHKALRGKLATVLQQEDTSVDLAVSRPPL